MVGALQGQADRRHLPRARPPTTSSTLQEQQATRTGTSSSSRAPAPRSATWSSTPRTRGRASPPSARRSPRSSTASALVHKVYKDTVEPLYSMVPKGLAGHTTGFFDDYGDPERGQGQARSSPRPASPSPCPLDPLVHHRPLRLRDRARSSRSSSGSWTTSGLFESPSRAAPGRRSQAGYQQGRVPGLRARLVPRLPGRRQLHRALRRRAERARHALRRPARSPTSCCPPPAGRATAARRGRAVRATPSRSSSTTPGCCRCGRASSTSPPARRSGRRAGPRPVDDHDDVGAVPEDQLVAAGLPEGRCQWPPVGSEVQ